MQAVTLGASTPGWSELENVDILRVSSSMRPHDEKGSGTTDPLCCIGSPTSNLRPVSFERSLKCLTATGIDSGRSGYPSPRARQRGCQSVETWLRLAIVDPVRSSKVTERQLAEPLHHSSPLDLSESVPLDAVPPVNGAPAELISATSYLPSGRRTISTTLVSWPRPALPACRPV